MKRRRNASILVLALIFICPAGCVGKRGAVERIKENGVEVVLNHLEPYHIPGRPSSLTLQEILAVDTESDSVAKAGVTEIYLFDVDSQGNIYVIVPPTHPGNVVFKLSPEGKPLLSFGQMGQGPFELEYPGGLHIDTMDRVWVLESPKNKYHIYDSTGKPLAEGSPEGGFEDLVRLENGTFLISRMEKGDLKGKYLATTVGIYGQDFRIRRELDRFTQIPNRMIFKQVAEKYVCGTNYVFQAKAAAGRIFVGNSDRGYEILVYDLGGKLLRKIRKEYRPVPVSEEYRKKTLEMYKDGMPEYAAKIFFPENWHPFQSFLADDEGRLLVMTYEPGVAPGEFMFDIFDQDGVFTCRLDLSVVLPSYDRILARVRGDRLYVVQEKPSGFRRIAVYRMIWQ
ncbi:MAG: hypothetical protein ABSG19_10920 [Candidatus Aminicenantales bacterium]